MNKFTRTNIVLRVCRVRRVKTQESVEEIKNNPQVYTIQEGIEEITNNPQVYTTQEGIGEIKSNPQVYTTQEGIREIENNPQVYTTQESIERKIFKTDFSKVHRVPLSLLDS